MFKIYVGNLDPRTTIAHVRELFSPFATIEDAVLAGDIESGKGKPFAIIMVRDAEIGRAAVKATQGKRLFGKTLTINEVMKKGKAAAKEAKEVRQGPFGPHFNRQGGGRAGTGSRLRTGGVRRGMNRGPRGPGFGAAPGGTIGGSSLGGSSTMGSGGRLSVDLPHPGGSDAPVPRMSEPRDPSPRTGDEGAPSA